MAGGASLVLMGAVGGGLVWAIDAVVGTATNPDWWRVGVLGILATLGVWVIRIAVRLFLSNFHLQTDAEERAVMVNVYLSLLEDDKADMSPDDRRIILQALFRPTSTGIVKDDAAPPGVIEVVTRTIGR